MTICKCGRNIPNNAICLCSYKDNEVIAYKDKEYIEPNISNIINESISRSESYTSNLWGLLHTYKHKSKEETQKWLEEWKNKLSCGRCKKHYEELVKENPIDFENFFEWGVKIHNLVNNKLNKPEVTVEQAREIWKA